MFNRLRLTVVACIALTTIVSIGCSGEKKPKDLPKLFPTEVVIKMKDQPLDGATVEMIKDGSPEIYVSGKTNTEGKAVISTRGKYAGAPEGEFSVIVKKNNVIEGPTFKKGEPSDPGKVYAWRSKCDKERKIVAVLAPQFSDPAKTPLKASVKSGSNKFEFAVDPAKK